MNKYLLTINKPNSIDTIEFDLLEDAQNYMERVCYAELNYDPEIAEEKEILDEYSDYWKITDFGFEIYPTQTFWDSRMSGEITKYNNNNITLICDNEEYHFKGHIVNAKFE